MRMSWRERMQRWRDWDLLREGEGEGEGVCLAALSRSALSSGLTLQEKSRMGSRGFLFA